MPKKAKRGKKAKPKKARRKRPATKKAKAGRTKPRTAKRKKAPAAKKVEAAPAGKNGRVGAALVVGGGIGGIQAALDLAESGIKVYVVEKGPSIGGAMSQLDKTFPTNDCSLCILSPKMVEAGRHRNIELLTYSELTGLEGAPGSFRARVLRRARSVDMTKCTGCGTCVQGCLVHNRIRQREPADAEAGLSPEDVKYLQEVVARNRSRPGAVMQVLQDIQRDRRYLPGPYLRYAAAALGVTLSQVYGIVTFYTAFSLEPKGRHVIKVCTGTACHVRGSRLVLDRLQRELDIGPGETTEDGEFTLETVRCLGCCGLAPAVVVDGKTYGRVRPDSAPELLEQYRRAAV